MSVRGPKSKIEEQRFVVPHGEMTAKKMARFHRETEKKIALKKQHDRQTDGHTYIHTDRLNDKE